MELTGTERERYARHLTLPDFGEEGQQRLGRGSVLVIGAGGLGSPVILYLAAAGVGRIGIIDGDRVDLSNLQRQIIHTTARIGEYKAESAAAAVRALNPGVATDVYTVWADRHNLPELVERYDFVIDATDSMAIKFLVNDVCVAAGRPYNHGAIWQYEGQTMTVLPGTTDYRTLFPDEPDIDAAAATMRGPLGVVPGILGTIQAAEAIKYLAGTGELLTDRLLRFDARTMRFSEIRLR